MRPSTTRVLRALQEAGEAGITTAELCQPDVGGIRFGARIHELRDQGLVITRVQLRPGRWRYWLREDPFGEWGEAA